MEHPAKSPGTISPVPEGDFAQQPQGQNDHVALSMQGSNSNLLQEDPSSPNALNNDRAAEVQDLQRVDKNARTVLHRAALDQNHSLVIQLCERADKVGLVNYVDTIDKFGNTPLLSACVMHNPQTSKNKLHCIEALIKNKADPNKRNDTTLWTPLTWCSFYGETEAITKLLENKAFPYLADNEGRFPLDHCGLQDKHGNRKKAATVLIESLMQLIQKYDESPENLAIEGYADYRRHLGSPLLRTSVLYWAIYFKLSVDDYVKKLLATGGVYPEFPIKTIFDRNCFHACAYEDNKEVLQILLNTQRYSALYKEYLGDKRSRGYDTQKSILEKEETDKMFAFSALEIKNKVYTEEFIEYTKRSVRWLTKFETAVAKMVLDNMELPKYYEEQDYFGNTPLHIASFCGRADIVAILLSNGADITIENKDGWRCEELKQYPKIEQMYKKHAKQLCEDELGLEINRNIGFQLNLLPQARNNPVSENKKKEGFFKRLFRKNKVADTHTKSMKKQKKSLKEKLRIYNEERFIPDVVLVFQTKSVKDNKASNAEMDRINFNIKIVETVFDCYLAANITNTRFYLMIKMNEQRLEHECASNSIKIKLLNAYGHQIYDPTRKVDFEPFRSRQRQEITLTSLNKLIDIQQLKDIGILKDVYTMHTVSGIHRIKEIWFGQKWYWPEPLTSVSDYLKEGKDINFTAITTLRMYFGEKVAFYFAWVSFYTSFLLFLAVPGIAIAVALWARPETDSYLLPLWSVFNSLASTLVVERWKRKSAEIATRWGTIDMTKNESQKRILRSEFVGDETVHETTGVITKTSTNKQTTLYFILSLPILLILLAAVVGSFLYSQHLQNVLELYVIVRMLISAANGVIIAVINIIYMYLARFFVDRENHKYADAYENSLIFKVFIFQFLNSYLGVFYVITQEDLTNIPYFLISLLITKQSSSITTTCVVPWIKYKFLKYRYFRAMKNKAQEEWAKMKEENNQEATGKDKGKDKKGNWAIKRPVLNCRKGTAETDKWDVTRVELSSLRTRNDEFVDEFGQMLIQCGYVTMFAPGFPLGPLISVVFNIVDMRARLFSLLHIHHRPPSERAGNIGVWQNIWEVTSIVGIFANALILFFKSDTTVGFLESALMAKVGDFEPNHNIRRLWVFLILVNLILIIKLLVSALIKDKPDWVEKEEKRQNNEERQALQNQKTQTLVAVPEENKEAHHAKAQKGASTTSIKDITQQPNQGASHSSKPTKLQKPTQSKLKIKEVIHQDTASKPAMPLASAALNLNYGIKSLLFNAYTYVEKELMMKRLGHLGNLMQEIVIKCDVCKKDKASLECLNCSERYCNNCLQQVHKKTVKTVHTIISLNKTVDGAQAVKGFVADVIPQIRDFPTSDVGSVKDTVHWQKVESFSFPTMKVGDPYNNVEKAFKLLYRVYIEENGISVDNVITNVELALKMKKNKKAAPPSPGKKSGVTFKNAEQPNQEAETAGIEKKKEPLALKQQDLGEVDCAWMDEVRLFFEMTKFNLEEKLWMNRIAFMIFKKRGAKTTYNDFLRQLKILEEAPFEAKIILLFDLMDEDGDGSVTVNDLLKLINVSFLQSMSLKANQDDVIKAGFKGVKTLDKKEFVDEVLQNNSVKQLLMAYMQIRT